MEANGGTDAGQDESDTSADDSPRAPETVAVSNRGAAKPATVSGTHMSGASIGSGSSSSGITAEERLQSMRRSCFRELADLSSDQLAVQLSLAIDLDGVIRFVENPGQIGRIRPTFGGRTLCATCCKHGGKCKVLVQSEGRLEEVYCRLLRWIVVGVSKRRASTTPMQTKSARLSAADSEQNLRMQSSMTWWTYAVVMGHGVHACVCVRESALNRLCFRTHETLLLLFDIVGAVFVIVPFATTGAVSILLSIVSHCLAGSL